MRSSLVGMRALLIGFLVFLIMPAFASPAPAEPEMLEEAKEEAAALRQQIDALNEEVSIAVEEYNYASSQLSETKAAIEESRQNLERAEQDLATAQTRLEKRIKDLYTGGRIGFLEALLSADSLSDLVNRWELLSRIGSSDSEVVAQVGDYRSDVAARKERLAADLERQKELVAEAEAAKGRVQRKLSERERLLDGKEREVARLEEEERKRQERLAAEARAEAARRAAAEQAAAEEAAAQAEREESTGSASGSPASSSSPSPAAASAPSADVPSSAKGSGVVSTAKQYMGVPYVWAGASPSGFDCSGFTQYVFKQVGVSLPHSSRAQFGYGVGVSRSSLEPGDLVFFGSPIHHVGIYVGGGSMIHAPYSGTNVRIDSMDRRDYVGARRIQ